MKLIIGGLQTKVTEDQIILAVNTCIKNLPWQVTEVVHDNKSGTARIGAEYCQRILKIPTYGFYLDPTVCHSQYHIMDRLRNRKMAERGDHLMVIWDGSCVETEQLLDAVRQLRKPISIFSQDWLNEQLEFQRTTIH